MTDKPKADDFTYVGRIPHETPVGWDFRHNETGERHFLRVLPDGKLLGAAKRVETPGAEWGDFDNISLTHDFAELFYSMLPAEEIEWANSLTMADFRFPS
jgi:hypothetical protein